MRLEATIPESRGTAVVKLAEELGLSRSQIVDEALSLFMKAVLEFGAAAGSSRWIRDPRSRRASSRRRRCPLSSGLSLRRS
jgi:hypothetical protein